MERSVMLMQMFCRHSAAVPTLYHRRNYSNIRDVKYGRARVVSHVKSYAPPGHSLTGHVTWFIHIFNFPLEFFVSSVTLSASFRNASYFCYLYYQFLLSTLKRFLIVIKFILMEPRKYNFVESNFKRKIPSFPEKQFPNKFVFIFNISLGILSRAWQSSRKMCKNNSTPLFSNE